MTQMASLARPVFAGVLVISILVGLAAGAMVTRAFDSQPAGPRPTPLTAQQCSAAKAILQNSSGEFMAFLARQGASEATRAEYQADNAANLEWVAQGCPPDDVRGMYLAADGKSGEMRLSKKQWFTGPGQIAWTTP